MHTSDLRSSSCSAKPMILVRLRNVCAQRIAVLQLVSTLNYGRMQVMAHRCLRKPITGSGFAQSWPTSAVALAIACRTTSNISFVVLSLRFYRARISSAQFRLFISKQRQQMYFSVRLRPQFTVFVWSQVEFQMLLFTPRPRVNTTE